MTRGLRGLAQVAAIGVLAVVAPAVAQADTFYASPSVADGSSGGGDCTDQSDPCSLRQALDDTQGDFNLPITVILAPGTYTLTQGQLLIDGGVSGNSSGFDATIEGQGAHASDTVITAGGASRVLQYGDEGGGSNGNDELKDVELTGGNAPVGGGIYLYEGGIANVGLTLDGTVVTGNSATTAAGGIYSDDYLTVDSSTISDNTVTGSDPANGDPTAGIGAGIDNDGTGLNPGGVLAVNDATIAGNTVSAGSQGQGGGIYNGGAQADSPAGNGVATVTQTTIAGNTTPASTGGAGLYDDETTSTSGVTLTDSIVADDFSGGQYADHDCEGVLPVLGGGNDLDCPGATGGSGNTSEDPELVKHPGSQPDLPPLLDRQRRADAHDCDLVEQSSDRDRSQPGLCRSRPAWRAAPGDQHQEHRNERA